MGRQRERRPPGRPPKPPAAQLRHVISFRVCDSELAVIARRAARAGRNNVTAFAKAVSLGKRLTVRHETDPRVNAAAVAALNRLGVNLNQIARQMNSGRYVDHDEISALILRIERQMDELLGS